MPKKNTRNIDLSTSDVEHYYGDSFTLSFTGRTPKGGDLTVKVKIGFEEWPFIQDRLTEAYRKRRAQLVGSMQRMDGAFNFKP